MNVDSVRLVVLCYKGSHECHSEEINLSRHGYLIFLFLLFPILVLSVSTRAAAVNCTEGESIEREKSQNQQTAHFLYPQTHVTHSALTFDVTLARLPLWPLLTGLTVDALDSLKANQRFDYSVLLQALRQDVVSCVRSFVGI